MLAFGAETTPARLRWADFETDAEIARWKPLGTRFQRSSEFVTSGRSSARIHFSRYTGAKGEAQWPRVTAYADDGLYPPDWSGWAALAFDAATDAGDNESVTVSVEIRDRRGRNGWTGAYTLPPHGVRQITIPLSDVAEKVNVSHVAEFLIYKGRPARDFNVYVDNIRLVTPALFAMHKAVRTAESTLETLWTKEGANADLAKRLAALKQTAAASTLTLVDVRRLTDQVAALGRAMDARRIRPLRAFDFGPVGSPVRAGFRAVSAKDAYSDAKGFGWLTPPASLKDRSWKAARGMTMSSYYGRKIPPRVYLTDLTQDLVGGTASAEFAIRVPPGEYAVWMLAGAPGGWKPFVNNFAAETGEDAAVRIGLPQENIFQSVWSGAKVGERGRLVVRFRPETGFVINALAVFPADAVARARKEFAGVIEREVFLAPPEIWAKWRRVPCPSENPAPPPSAVERERGWVLFHRPFVRNVYPDSQPQADERFEQLRTFATPGEYEPFTFSIRALRDLEGVTVAVGDLRGPGGARLPATRIDVRQVRCWPVRTRYSSLTSYKIVPELLDSVRPADLDAGTCRRYWLTVHVPEESRPGVYRGAAWVRGRGWAAPVRVPLELEVLPFRLRRDPNRDFGNYYRSPLDRIRPDMAPVVVRAIRRRAEAEAADMQAHGMTTVQMPGIGAKKIDGQWRVTVGLSADRIAFLQRFGLWGRSKGVMMPAFFTSSIYRDLMGKRWPKHLRGAKMPPDAYFDAVTRLIEQAEKVRIARGWPVFYYYPIDEAAPDAVPILARTLAAIKKVPTAGTYATQVFELDYNRPLDDVLDVWCSAWFCTDTEAVDAMRRKGRTFWCYPNFVACSRGVPNSARMTYGFGVWRMGYACLIPWHYQAPCGNPFTDFDATFGDWCMAYPGSDGPIPTQRWEAAREGIDDGRYIYTLETRLRAAKASGQAAGAVTAGETVLRELRNAVPVRKTYDQDGPWKGPEYDSWRRRLAEAIMALPAAE